MRAASLSDRKTPQPQRQSHLAGNEMTAVDRPHHFPGKFLRGCRGVTNLSPSFRHTHGKRLLDWLLSVPNHARLDSWHGSGLRLRDPSRVLPTRPLDAPPSRLGEAFGWAGPGRGLQLRLQAAGQAGPPPDDLGVPIPLRQRARVVPDGALQHDVGRALEQGAFHRRHAVAPHRPDPAVGLVRAERKRLFQRGPQRLRAARQREIPERGRVVALPSHGPRGDADEPRPGEAVPAGVEVVGKGEAAGARRLGHGGGSLAGAPLGDPPEGVRLEAAVRRPQRHHRVHLGGEAVGGAAVGLRPEEDAREEAARRVAHQGDPPVALVGAGHGQSDLVEEAPERGPRKRRVPVKPGDGYDLYAASEQAKALREARIGRCSF
mmetsp:Transcript_24527/g.58299  ORF Transcript_24527/g.58299 Transcript_24527/m.58299 type:complete len:376 (+) Transcript_24527:135-1262(+)